MKSEKIVIAKIGKTYGIKGWQKIHLLTDFPSQFQPGKTFESDKINLTIENLDLKRGLIKFKGYDTPEKAKLLTNRKLYSTIENTRKELSLDENEYFWFDIIGCKVYENGKRLGKVKDIQRADVDYLLIFTDDKLIKKGYPKRFMIDFKRHIKSVDIKNKKMEAQGAFDILESLK